MAISDGIHDHSDVRPNPVVNVGRPSGKIVTETYLGRVRAGVRISNLLVFGHLGLFLTAIFVLVMAVALDAPLVITAFLGIFSLGSSLTLFYYIGKLQTYKGLLTEVGMSTK